MANFSKAPRFEGKVVLSKTSLIGTVSEREFENARSKVAGHISPMKASRMRGGNKTRYPGIDAMLGPEERAKMEMRKHRSTKQRRAEIDRMKKKQEEFREMMDKEDEEENRRREEKHRQMWAEIRERRKQDQVRAEAEAQDKAARQEAFRIRMEQQEAEAQEKRLRESARIKKVIEKREADHQANLERYRRMAREELAREEEEARKAGKSLYSL